MGQTVLDVEVWANSLLCSELDTRGLSYHCLLDYDLQVVQVSLYNAANNYIDPATIGLR